jgi:hypothetical protein
VANGLDNRRETDKDVDKASNHRSDVVGQIPAREESDEEPVKASDDKQDKRNRV